MAVQKESESNFIKALMEFNNDLEVQELRNIYYNKTFLEVLGTGRRELSHSSFLAWLFSTTENHGLGALPLTLLLELYILNMTDDQKEDNCISKDLFNSIITRDLNILKCDGITEEAVEINEAKGRADIVLTCEIHRPNQSLNKLKIVIENKVYSNEHSYQTKTYFNYYENIKKDNKEIVEILYIYLTPPKEEDAECLKFIHITYQDILDHVLEPLRIQPDINSRTQFILNEYIACLSVPSDVIMEENSKVKNIPTTVLAIGKREKELLKKFWEEHKSLICTLIQKNAKKGSDQLLKEYNVIEDTDNENINNIIKSLWDKHKKLIYAVLLNGDIENSVELLECIDPGRDNSKYRISNDPKKYGKRRLVEAVVKQYLDHNQDATIEDLKTIFSDDQQLQGSLPVIRSSKDTIRDITRYFEAEHPKTKETYYICNQWGIGNINNFINHVNQNIEGIEIKKIN